LALAKDLKDPFEHDRHHGNMAHKLAGVRPEDAMKALALVRDAAQRERYLARVCYRMARADLSRARSLADTAREPAGAAYALGVMACAIAPANPNEARGILASAFEKLLDRR